MYANQNCVNSLSPSTAEVANFLAHLFTQDASYSAVNTARSALSAFLPQQNGRSVGSNPDVCCVAKGVFEARPPLPKYQEKWDVNIVLNHLDSLPEVEDMSLKQLTLRMCMLLALLTGQRGHAFHLLKVEDIKLKDSLCTIIYSEKAQAVKARISCGTS